MIAATESHFEARSSIQDESLFGRKFIKFALQLSGFCHAAGFFEGSDGLFGAGGGGWWVERGDEGHPEQTDAGVIVVMDGEEGAADDEFRAGALPPVKVAYALLPEGRFRCSTVFRMQQAHSP